MKTTRPVRFKQDGFTAVEFVVASVIFAIIVIGLTNGYIAIRRSYSLARQLNEMYTVLSACPELDRAVEFSSLSSTSNCYPNNSFPAENGGGATITYTPSLTVTPTNSLPNSDPLKNIPDSKVVNITVGFQKPYNSQPSLQLKMLITRNGIAQS
jgi:prepilin-type N-terminal cleavage/methylation domain-containing protein